VVNPNNQRSMDALGKAILHSRRELQDFRSARLMALRQFVGSHYHTQSKAGDKVPINLIEMLVSIYTRQLAATCPQVNVFARNEQNKPSAFRLELAMNHVLKHEMPFERNLRITTKDAMFGLGLMKVGVTSLGLHEAYGYMHDSGMPFADPVSLDDWVHDMTVPRFELCAFMGDRYRIPMEQAKEWADRNKDSIEEVTNRTYNEHGDIRAEAMSQGLDAEKDTVVPMTEVWDIWLPREKLVVTIPASSISQAGYAGSAKVLKVVEYDGREAGPYHILNLNEVPSNTMPVPPASLMMDLHDLANHVFRKLGRQAERQKSMAVYRKGSEEDAETFKDASDGEAYGMDDPSSVQPVDWGGPNPTNLAFFIQIRELFSYLGGNLDTLGGLSPQSETLGQDEMLAANASQRVSDMQDQTVSFTRDVVRHIGSLLWDDPVYDLEIPYKVTENYSLPVKFSPDIRTGKVSDYEIDIEPFSMQHNTPARRLKAMGQVMQQYIMPMIPVMMAKGEAPNMKRILGYVSKYANLPELNEFIEFVGEDTFVDQMSGRGGGGAPAGDRTVTRVNRPGATQSGKDDVMKRLLLGSNVQDSEAAAIGRPNS